MEDTPKNPIHRRTFLAFLAGMGVCSMLPKEAWGRNRSIQLNDSMIEEAEKLIGIEFTKEERELLREGVEEYLGSYQTMRKISIVNDIPPAWKFSPLPSNVAEPIANDIELPETTRKEEELPHSSVTELAYLLKHKQITSKKLTEIYLERLKKYQSLIQCSITITEDLALEQAQKADEEIAAGNYRGVLHGIPYGLKDLFATKKYPTTWGANPYKEQVLEEDATVVKKLQEAGAVLVSKLSTGALAWGDAWFDGKTRNPWNPKQGSSGSSAGPAAAVSAGLVAFSIGTETWGSIVSPCTRCGVTGLRPTFGRISRHGCMALSWTMDKVGPIARTVEDCEHILAAIYGPDGKDLSVVDNVFHANAKIDTAKLKIGYVASAFQNPQYEAEWKQLDEAVLKLYKEQNIELIPIQLPDYPVESLAFILQAEAAAAFDELTRDNRDDEMTRQGRYTWPNVFRQARFIPAVEYIQANRIRTLLMRKMEEIMEKIDVYICPSYGGDNLLLTNLTGHPSIVVPNGFVQDSPRSISFTGRLYEEHKVAAVARIYQNLTNHHRKIPKGF